MPDLIEMIVFNVFTNRRGPNIENSKEILQTMQVGGAPTQKLTKSAYNNVQVGEQRNKFYENIISIPLLRIAT
ncbi:Nitrogen regulation protein NIFR3 [Staphylococcus aureus]|uniref:Nitrogen regulation protein NIFR3 n=1 Tax=Staphylococcus aureus TaxID=1280 RepID=A0A380DU49_STAAU|nr:Nitrogen regulation protein NIFR3 [Staphylococcus aureus]